MGDAILSFYKPNSALGMVTCVARKMKKLGSLEQCMVMFMSKSIF